VFLIQIQIVQKLKDGIYILNKSEYPEVFINYLIKNVGISEEHAKKIFENINHLKKLKTFSIILGVVLSLSFYFILTNISLFSNIPNFVFLISALVIFILFVLEGYLITRMPNKFYLNLININKDKLLAEKKEIYDKENKIKNYNKKQSELLDDIKKVTKFLLNQNVEENAIINFFKKYDISEEKVKEFINFAKESVEEDKTKGVEPTGNILFKTKSDAAIKLTLSKIHDSFEQINQIYNEVTKLQQEVFEISERQKKLEKRSTINVSKEVKKLKNEPIIKNKFKGLEKLKDNETKEIKELLERKNVEYEKLISYLYHLFLPYVETSSKNDVFSTLVYYGYPYEVVEDVLEKFKEKNILFGKDKQTSLSERIVNKINRLYDLFS